MPEEKKGSQKGYDNKGKAASGKGGNANGHKDWNKTNKDGQSGSRSNNQNNQNPGKVKQDSMWYKLSEAVNAAVSNVPFNVFPGTMETVGDPSAIATPISSYVDESGRATPGVLVMRHMLSYGGSVGSSGNPAAAVNIAAKALYTWVRHLNSGHTNYDSPDLMLYILAMDHIYTRYLELRRDLALSKTYYLTNRNVPDLLLNAIGYTDVQIKDMREKQACYMGQLNLIAAKISSMAVPNKFHIFKRHALLAINIFTDSDSRRSQFYLFQQKGVRKYDPTYDDKGGGLAYETISTGGFQDRLDQLSDMVDRVISDEDMNIMSGDILKAYGQENLYTLSECGATETANIVFDENVLQQIENALIFSYDDTKLDIHQNNNVLIENYIVDPTSSATNRFTHMLLSGNVYFNSHKEAVTPDDAMEYSRLMISCDLASDGNIYLECGSEIIWDARMVRYTYDSSGTATVVSSALLSILYNNVGNVTNTIIPLDKFDWHPGAYLYVVSGTSPNYSFKFEGVLIDLKMYTLIANDARKRLNDVAIMAELGGLVLQSYTR